MSRCGSPLCKPSPCSAGGCPSMGIVAPLLDDPELAIDTADALAASARPPARDEAAAEMLASNQRPFAGQPCGHVANRRSRARPAVDFMVRSLRGATEVEGYNMMIYLALLGPVAKDAAQRSAACASRTRAAVGDGLGNRVRQDSALARPRRFGPGGPGGGQGPTSRTHLRGIRPRIG